MDYLYKTVLKRARAEIVIEKSRFISTVTPVESREEAESFFSEIRAEFKDATHNVPAFIIGNKKELKWASDDGEPQGTSGPPILNYLEKKDLTNLAVVVTRYFGGIKLGTGGLVRAYTEAADAAVIEAGIAGAAIFIRHSLIFDYASYNKLRTYRFPAEMLSNMIISEPVFGENVSIDLACHGETDESLKRILMDITSGDIAPQLAKEKDEEILSRFALTMDT